MEKYNTFNASDYFRKERCWQYDTSEDDDYAPLTDTFNSSSIETNTKEDYEMSFLCIAFNKNGIVMGADSRSTRKINHTDYMGLSVTDDDFQKIFLSNNLIIGTYGENTMILNGFDRAIGTIISDILEKYPDITREKFLSEMAEFSTKNYHSISCNASFIIGEKDSDGYIIREYKYTNGSAELVKINTGYGILYAATTNIFPEYEKKLDSNADISDMKKYVQERVHAMIEIGKIMEKHDITPAYHVGGKVYIETFSK